jgi:predicted regulator of Ras-like GTPase activity (Roadblock/LC7/MglB family)
MIQPRDSLEAVVLFTRTGKMLAAWTRNEVPLEVLTVMAATLIGSIETLSTAMGGASPREITLLIDTRRVLGLKLSADVAILVVASGQMSDVALRSIAERIVRRLPPLSSLSRGGTRAEEQSGR